MSVYSFPPQGSRIEDRGRPPQDDLALVGLVFGVVGVLFGLLPLVFWMEHLLGIIGIILEPFSLGVAGLLGAVGIIISLVAFVRAMRRGATNRRTSLAGMATSGISLALALIGVAVVFAPVIDPSEGATRPGSEPSILLVASSVCSSAEAHSSERSGGIHSVASRAGWIQRSPRCTLADLPTSPSTTASGRITSSHGSGCAPGCRHIQS